MVKKALSLSLALMLSTSYAITMSPAYAQEEGQNQAVHLVANNQNVQDNLSSSLQDPVQNSSGLGTKEPATIKADQQAQLDVANARAKDLEIQLLEEKVKNLQKELEQKSDAPKVKVYGNKTPTKVGTREEVQDYLKDLEQERAKNSQIENDRRFQVYTDENGNVVTVDPGNNYNIYYEGVYGNNGYPPPPPPPPPYPPYPPYGSTNPVYPPDPVDPGFNHPSSPPPYPGARPPYPSTRPDPGFNHPGSSRPPYNYNQGGNTRSNYGVTVLPPANGGQPSPR